MSLETAREERSDIWDTLSAALEAFPRIRNRNHLVLAELHYANCCPPAVLVVSCRLDTLGSDLHLKLKPFLLFRLTTPKPHIIFA